MTAASAALLDAPATLPQDERVVLVDEQDRAVGTMEKLAAHREGRLHRALSVVLRSPEGRLLMQRRAAGKYHSGGVWTNTCCSHPRPGEEPEAAARRRLAEEMGIHLPRLEPLFETVYRAEVGDGLVEHEYVHVFGAVWDGAVDPDPSEVEDWAWVDPVVLKQDMARNPERYSAWFRRYAEVFWDRMIG
ncbi:isopentenyl-diphosphate Delta-isomerase [Elioraea thermophila]|uniref:isopentenyl-diphosphate Delta-isomerase n=1 Tax=Elioraea thermophila TaxID=2185104 RepID=UPI000DF43BF7|nr:isopentenyl-diphosphate Delta-isomerase [Elioraea thermophila]